MDEKNIRKAFWKVKRDILLLRQELGVLNENLRKINEKIEKIEKNSKIAQNEISTQIPKNQTQPQKTSTHPYRFKPLKPQNLHISTGNQGASTDRQTDRHIDRHPMISYEKTQKTRKIGTFEDFSDSIAEAAEILDSLDSIRKDIRLKFKRLTNQEMLIFTAIYQLEEEQGRAEYRTLSEKLGLSESSIRDYVGRIIKKGIPVEKIRIKNKNIQLYISPNLKRLATLSTIVQLRDL